MARTSKCKQHGNGQGCHPVDRVEIGELRDAGKPLRAAGKFDILNYHANDFAEAERDNRQIIALEAQRRDTDDQAENGGDNAGYNKRRQKRAETGGRRRTVFNKLAASAIFMEKIAAA